MPASEDDDDPFRLLADRRAEAEAAGADPERARKSIIDTAFKIILPIVNQKAIFYFRYDEDVRKDATQDALESLYKYCNKIYDGTREPPRKSWKGFIAQTVKNMGITIMDKERRHGGTGFGSVIVVPLDTLNSANGGYTETSAPEEDATLSQEFEDDLLRRLSQLRGGVHSGEFFCAFHPGRRCPHLLSGAPCKRCMYPNLVFDSIEEVIISAPVPIKKIAHIKKLLTDRIGYDSKRQGNALRRHGYRCLDWFVYLLLRDVSGRFGEDWLELSALSKACVAQHLMGEGVSETTLCILMNDYLDIPIPPQLMREYAPKHLLRTEGELR